jgi:hypothetical protein
VKFLNAFAESDVRPNRGILKILLSQLIKAELRKMFCRARMTELLIFFTVNPLDSLNASL